MAWVEFHQALPRHPKTLRVAVTLGVSRAQVCGHLAMLWCWALDARPDGGPLDAIDVIAGAEWEQPRKDFVGALMAAGFLDAREDGMWLHDWDDYAGRLVAQRRANKQRMRDARAANVQRTTAARAPATVPNPTVPNPTEQNQTGDQKPEGARKRATVVDEAFKRSMYERFPSRTPERIDDEIADALGHSAAKKRTDLQAYVRNWLVRAFDEPRGVTQLRPPTGYLKPVAVGAFDHLIHRSYE